MEKFEDILDYQEENEYGPPEWFLASGGTRFANYFIDQIGIYVYSSLLSAIFGSEWIIAVLEEFSAIGFVLVILIYAGYWVLPEYFWGKTPAKFITRTKVVTKDGRKPTLMNIVGRTLCRMIPFDAFSFLFSSPPVGWHDSISGTRVVSSDYLVRDDYS